MSKVSQRLATNREATKTVLKTESAMRKRVILIGSIVTAVITLIFASLHLARFGSVANFQSMYDGYNPRDLIIYDTSCANSLPFSFGAGDLSAVVSAAAGVASDAVANANAAVNAVSGNITSALTNTTNTASQSAQATTNSAQAEATAAQSQAQNQLNAALSGFGGRRLQDNTINTAIQGLTNTTNSALSGANNATQGASNALASAANSTIASAAAAAASLEGVALSLANYWYTDANEAWDIAREIIDDCGTDQECYERGSRWSHVYLSNGLLLLFIMCNLCCISVGTYYPMLRMIGACCAPFLCLAHFGVIVAAGVYRYQNHGRLCALYKGWSHAPTSDWTDVNDDWTFEKDGQLITALFILQLLGCFWCLFLGCYPMMIPKQ